MDRFPYEPAAFTEAIARHIKATWRDRKVEVIDALKLLVDGRRMGLENLYRLVMQDTDRAAEVVGAYFRKVFEGDLLATAALPLAVAKPRIMPRLQPESIFDSVDREQVAHIPFVNGTVIVFVIDLPDMTVSISTEQLVRWGLTTDELEEVARVNLGSYAPELNVQIMQSGDGGRAAVVSLRDGYDAARLLLTHLHDRLAPELKGDFLVATPARDIFVAMSRGPGRFIDRIMGRIDEDYRRLPYPITRNLFYVTRDGVAGTAEAA
ncbi:MAG: hypothetical protein RLZZ217_400 [Planctomycetota bacterium]|jgi:uncharacterized protein YtpQ (UPF0354 family)